MLQKILVIFLLLTVEFSTFNQYCNDYKAKIEVNAEDNTESENLSKEMGFDKFFVSNSFFQFVAIESIQKSSISMEVSLKIPQALQLIDSPPPR